MHDIATYELSLYVRNVQNAVVRQLPQEAFRRRKQFQFWDVVYAFRWPTDLVSFGQVEAKDKILYFVARP